MHKVRNIDEPLFPLGVDCHQQQHCQAARHRPGSGSGGEGRHPAHRLQPELYCRQPTGRWSTQVRNLNLISDF